MFLVFYEPAENMGGKRTINNFGLMNDNLFCHEDPHQKVSHN